MNNEQIKDYIELNSKVETRIFLDYDVINNAVTSYFGKDYEVAAYEELTSDDIFEVHVSKNIADYDVKIAEKTRMTGKYSMFSTSIYLSFMAKEGAIPEGIYIIKN